MKKKQSTPPEKPSQPFFVRFLETQELVKTNGARTLKYPSDGDEEW